jgi:hypothetical protein
VLLPPFCRLVEFAPLLIERDYAVARIRHVALRAPLVASRCDTLIPDSSRRLGLDELLLTDEAGAQHAFSDVSGPALGALS